jgi:hypothetical protein
MSRKWIAVLLLGAAWTGTSWAAEVQGGPAEAAIKAPSRPSAIHALEAETRATLESLEAEAARSADPEAVQRRVVETKQAAEWARLEILARECREQGREAEALEAEVRLEALRNPQPRESRVQVELSPEEKAALAARQPRTPRVDAGTPAGAPSSEEGGAQ